VGKAPSQNLVVSAARQDTLAQRGILDAQEAAAPAGAGAGSGLWIFHTLRRRVGARGLQEQWRWLGRPRAPTRRTVGVSIGV
jgi:hypothetical protein